MVVNHLGHVRPQRPQPRKPLRRQRPHRAICRRQPAGNGRVAGLRAGQEEQAVHAAQPSTAPRPLQMLRQIA